MNAQQVAAVLQHMGQLMEVLGENPFRVRALQNAARVLEGLEDEQFAALVHEDKLQTLKGIGKGIAEKTKTLLATGSLPAYEQLQQQVPSGLLDMMKLPGFGAKKVRVVAEQAGIRDLEALEAAARDGSLSELPGFGKKTAAKILESIDFLKRASDFHRAGEARAAGETALAAVRAHPSVSVAEIAGSLRRWKETVKDIDIVAVTDDAPAVMDVFTGQPQVARVTGHGEKKSSVLLRARGGTIPCDLRLCDAQTLPFMLHHFTGSKEHNVALRQRAIKMGYKLSEWGLFAAGDDAPVPCRDEAAIFKQLGLSSIIPPELRENRGEIEAAAAGELPLLIEKSDIRAELHLHTTASDGRASIREMAEACRERGFRYMGVTDHSRAAAYAGGLGVDALARQADEIDELNAAYGRKFEILKSSEVDILADGALDFDDETLARLDYVVASIHSRFELSKEKMTRRVIRAIENPATTIIGHLTGRLLLRRDGYDLAVDEVIAAAAEHGTALEINANPHRLDLDWRYVKRARDKGVKIAINTDAHASEQLDYLQYGIGIARKGWLEKGDVINTLSPREFRAFVRKKKK